MSILVDAIRPFWAPGLNNIDGNPTINLLTWIEGANGYQIYNEIESEKFILSSFTKDEYLRPIACDCNRMIIAALESINTINRNTVFPKSTAWTLLQAYYAAFYSAHAILRMLGISITNIENIQISKVMKIAKLYGSYNGVYSIPGLYRCSYINRTNELTCEKIILNGGSHEALWSIFSNKVKDMSYKILQFGSTIEIQTISTKLDELNYNLTFAGANGGNWLSRVRNEINYKHLFGAWYPYKLGNYQDEIFTMASDWRKDPMLIPLNLYTGKEILRFFSTCQFLISLSLYMSFEMAKRCPSGKSFHLYGSLAFLNHLEGTRKT